MTAVPTLPFPRSYWVSPGKLLAGCYPGDFDPGVARQKLQGLAAAGVTQVISLMEAGEVDNCGRPFVDYRPEVENLAAEIGRAVVCRRFEIPDMGVPTVTRMAAILDAIDKEEGRGGCTYVHCWGGKGRTGTVVGCWLVRHNHASANDVLLRLADLTAHNRAAFPEVPQTVGQRRFVCSWLPGA